MNIYLDHNSTTPVDPRAVEAMLPFMRSTFGNPSSAHSAGATAHRAVERAREQVAELVGGEPGHIIFCSSATEAINQVILSSQAHVLTTVVEHAATLRAATLLESRGGVVTHLPVDRNGCLDVVALEDAISERTALVSILWANNETGVVFPIERIAACCAARGVALHVDAVQAAGKLSIDLTKIPIDFLTISGHKLNGPKGSAALIASPQRSLAPLVVGGGQERGRRAGTENVPAIVGFGAACGVARAELASRAATTAASRDRLEQAICERVPRTWVNGGTAHRVPNTTNIGFGGVDGDDLVGALDARGICVSTGSACLASAPEPSHVIFAMTGSAEMARSSVRFSVGHSTTHAEVDRAIAGVIEAVAELQQA